MNDSEPSRKSYRICARCIMDTRADPAIDFDVEGVCNHCRRYDALAATRMMRGEAGERGIAEIIHDVKRRGRKRDYDCLIGVSGGVDSTYIAYLARKRFGLRPLAVHFDNGWDSELAVKNIERVLTVLGIDLYTYVVDWEEFRDLQLAFLQSSTTDGEIPTDMAIPAVLWKEAARRGIKYILSGMNFATESIDVPAWSYGHQDWRYIKDVHRRFGTKQLKTFPRFTFWDLMFINAVRGVRIVSPLNYMSYDKQHAMETLQNELGWVYYGGKHYESVYTRFWQGYVLPRKFGVDKRVGHLSDLINSGQMARQQALVELAKPAYPPELERDEVTYVIKKLGLTRAQFDQLMEMPVRTYRDYRHSFLGVRILKKMITALRKAGLYPK